MKQKNQIPLPEPAILQLQAQVADDVSLPKPRGFGKHEVTLAREERIKLEATKQFGGLLPVGRGSQYWQCPSCRAIHADRELVAACCQQIPNQVQICSTCLRTHNQALRIGECQCNQRDFIIRDNKTQLLLYGHQALKASVRNNRSEELLVFRIPAEAWVAFLQIGLQHIPPAAIRPVATYLKAVQRSQSFNPDPALLEDIDNVLEISLEGAEFLQRSVDEHPPPDDADWWINIWPN